MGSASPLSRLTSLFTTRRSVVPPPPPTLTRIRSKAEYQQFFEGGEERLREQFLSECALFDQHEPFTVDCFCYVCGKPGAFYVSFSFASEVQGRLVPAWRESLVCPTCQLNNRQRASIHLLDLVSPLAKDEPLYLTEQVTGLFTAMCLRHKSTQGSEYFGPNVERGKIDKRGIRNEDITELTFADRSFAAVMCFEVLEHVPEYKQAISELYRVLRPGGTLHLTVPFNPHTQDTLVRARTTPDGSIEFLLEPEYHSNPLSSDGCLCFYHFGWQILNELKSAGFADACLVHYGSRDYGYLGLEPLQIIATKGS